MNWFTASFLLVIVTAPQLALAANYKDNPDPVHFETDQSSLDESQNLSQQIRWLKKNKDRVVILAGHCDERGSNNYNLHLGDKRARAVMLTLLKAGISEKQLMIMSYGETQLKAKGEGETQWAENRRVEFVIR